MRRPTMSSIPFMIFSGHEAGPGPQPIETRASAKEPSYRAHAMIKVGICGFGYWGPNLVRNFALNPNFEVVAVADKSRVRQEQVRGINANVLTFDDATEMIDHGGIDAVAVATPAATHHAIAAHAIRRRKHVLVEKP